MPCVQDLSRLDDSVLLQDLRALVARDRALTVELLVHLAEVDRRRLYAAAGYPSMFVYCVEELRLSEGAAYKRILVARAVRRVPELLAWLEDGRLHLTAARLLAPHLSTENAEELMGAALGLRTKELEALLVARFGGLSAPPARIRTVVETTQSAVPQGVESFLSNPLELDLSPVAGPDSPVAGASASVAQSVPSGPAETPRPAPPVERAPARRRVVHALTVSLGGATLTKLARAQALLSHAIPSGDVAAILDRALDALIAQVERERHSQVDRPRLTPSSDPERGARPADARSIPAAVRRAVYARDRGGCTFVNAEGRRCAATRHLEYDHILPVARGGRSTLDNLRLRCRAHNRLAADETFGRLFMERKQAAARGKARRGRTVSREEAPRGHDRRGGGGGGARGRR